jgi:general L-amino acid transport system permease protein
MASFMIPLFLPGKVQVDALVRALIAITLFSSAYLAEAIRGGLQAVPSGQTEAAEALGLTYWQTSLLVVVPQALRLSIPAIANLFIGLFKDTSLVGIVGLTDLLLATKQALGDPQWRQFSLEGYTFVALIYVAFCFFISRYSRALERRLDRGHH